MADNGFFLGYPLIGEGSGSGNSDSAFVLYQFDPTAPNGKVIAAGTGITVTASGGYIVITNSASSSQGGTVSNFSAGNLSPIFSSSVATSTTTPALTFTLTNQTSATVLAGPSGGAAGAPTYRILTGNDIVNAIQAGTNITITNGGSVLTINAAGSGNVTTVADTGLSGLFTSSVSNPTTTPSISHAYITQHSGTVLAGPTGGADANPSFRVLVAPDISDILLPGTNITLTTTGSNITITSAGSSNTNGTVTSVGLSAPSIFSVSNSPVTTVGSLTFSLVTQPSGTFLAGPASGANGTPTFRYMIGSDVPILAGANVYFAPSGNAIVISSSGGGGSVTSFAANNITNFATANVATPTSTPTLSYTLTTQASNKAFMGPVSGADATPIFRLIQGQDISNIFIPGTNITIVTSGSNITLSAAGSSNTNGTVTNFTAGNLSPLLSTSVANPTTTPALSFTLTAQASSKVFAGPNSGADASPTFRLLEGGDLTSGLTAGSNITFTQTGSTITIASTASGGGGGTVTSVSAGNLSPIFNTSVGTPTTTPAITFSLTAAPSGTALMGPVSGTNASPTYRIIQGQDISAIFLAGTNVTLTPAGSNITITAAGSSNTNGTVTSVAVGNLANVFIANTTAPTTTPSTTFTGVAQPSGTAWLGPDSGTNAVPTFRSLVSSDTYSAISQNLIAGNNVTITPNSTNKTLTITAAGSSNTNGTVTNVSEDNLTPIWNTSVANPTTTPSVTHTLISQTSANFLAGPASGASAGAAFRTIFGSDIINALAAGTNISLTQSGTGPITITAAGSSNTNGTVTNFTAGSANPLFSTSVGTPTTTPALTFTLTNQPSGTFLAGPSAGANGQPWFRGIQGADIFPALAAGTNISLQNNGNTVTITAAGSSNVDGTVTSVALTTPGVLFSVAGSPLTHAGTIALSLINQLTGTVFCAPPSGAAGTPTFRFLTGYDLSPAVIAGSNITITNVGSALIFASTASSGGGGGSGTVTSFQSVDPLPWFNANVTNPTTTPTLTFSVTGTKGDLPFISANNTAGILAVGNTSQVVGVANGTLTNLNTLQGFASAVVSASLTIASKSYQNMDASAGAVTLTLGAASSMPEKVYYFKNNTVTGSAACTVQTNGTDTIEGSLVAKTITSLQVMGIISDGVNTWRYLEPQIKSPHAGGTGSAVNPTDGQVPIGSTSSGVYVPGNITAGAGINITNGANSISISSTAAGDTASTKTASFNAAVGNIYRLDLSLNAITVTLPNAPDNSGSTMKLTIVASATNAAPYSLIFNTSASQLVMFNNSGFSPSYRNGDTFPLESDGVGWCGY